MTLKYVDRILETSTTGGTGTLNLLGPLTGFRSFSVAGNNAKVGYVIDDGTLWEIGIGTVGVGSPNTLTRGANPIASSNSNALVNFGTNVKNVRLAPIAPLMMSRDESLNFTDLLGTVGGTANAHTLAMPVTSLGYTNGMVIMYRAPALNTSASVTVNVDSLGVKNLKINGADPGIGAITSGALIVAVYNTATGFFDVFSTGSLPLGGGNMAGGINEAMTTVASAATADIWTGTGNKINWTGTTTATGFVAAPQPGSERILICAGAAVFTAGTNMLIDGVVSGSNYTAAAGDRMVVTALTTTQFRLQPIKANGQPLVGISPFTSSFESAEQTITTTSQISVAHSLAGVPKLKVGVLRCKTAERGYSVGDEVDFLKDSDYTNGIVSVGADATNVWASISSNGLFIANKNGSTGGMITTANWKIVLRAWY